MNYTITADGRECFETDNESEAQEMLALLIAHQQEEPYCESSFQSVRNRQKVLHDLWRSDHPIAEIWANTRIYNLTIHN